MPSSPQESVIRRMTRLSLEHNAVNLSQGITDEPVLYDLAWAGIAAILGGSDEGAEQLQSLALRDLLSRNAGNDNRSLKDLCAILQPEHDRYNQYSFPYGLPELREAIADYTRRFYAFRPNPETQITVTAGATEGLSSTLRALCNPGDSVIVLQPFHEMYPNQASLFGLRCEYVTLREKSDGWAIDKDEWATAAKRARALILNTPHNPTGKVFSEAELAFIADLCCKRDLFLITDEIYEHILYGDCVHICPATLAGMAERTFVVNAITKTANASGWRVGWVLSPEQHTPRIRAVHDTLVVQAPTPLQKGAEHLLRLPDAIFKECSQTIFAKARSAPQRPPIHRIQNHPTRRFLLPLCRLPLRPHLMRHERNRCRHVHDPRNRRHPRTRATTSTQRATTATGNLRFAFCRTLDSLSEASRTAKKN